MIDELLAAYDTGVIARSELFMRLVRLAPHEDLAALPPEIAGPFLDWAAGMSGDDGFVTGGPESGSRFSAEELQALRAWLRAQRGGS